MNIKSVLAVLLLLPIVPAFAQEAVISNEAPGKFYIGVANPIKAMVEGYDCRSLMLRGDGMEILSTGGCSFDVFVSKPGKLFIEAGVNENGQFKVVATRIFRIKYIPDPVAKIAGKSRGIMTKEVFASADSIYAQLEDFDLDVDFRITGFKMAVSRDGKELFAHTIEGNQYGSAMKPHFGDILAGDKLVISDIHATGPDKIDRVLSEVVLMLK